VKGDVVTVAEPPVAATPVSDGSEKNVPSHAAGAAVVIDASLVGVTVSGLLALPLALTTCQWKGPPERPRFLIQKRA
jgi:hypothetical protein